MMGPVHFSEKSTMPSCGSTFVSSQVLVYMLGGFQDLHFIQLVCLLTSVPVLHSLN